MFPHYELYDSLVAMFALVIALHVSIYFLGNECLLYFRTLYATYNPSQFHALQFLFKAGFEAQVRLQTIEAFGTPRAT